MTESRCEFTESRCEFTVSFGREFEAIRSGFEVDLSQNVVNRREFTTFSCNSMALRVLVAFSQQFTATRSESHRMNSHGWAATTTLLPVYTGVWLLLSHSLHSIISLICEQTLVMWDTTIPTAGKNQSQPTGHLSQRQEG